MIKDSGLKRDDSRLLGQKKAEEEGIKEIYDTVKSKISGSKLC